MLQQNSLLNAHKLKLRWFVTLSTLPLLGVVTAFGIMPQSDVLTGSQKTLIQEIALPTAAQAAPSTTTFWRNERVQRGDTVVELLRRLNVEDEAASEYLRQYNPAASFRQLGVGKEVQAETNAEGALLALRYLDNENNQVIIAKSGDSFTVDVKPALVEQRTFVRTGEIESSLFAATDEAGLPDPAANQLAEIFGGDIDFHRDLRKGDKFSVIYEMTYINGEAARTGRILAAEFINQGRTYRAVYFQTTSFSGDYYSPDGKSMRKAFLRSPIEFSRVSSGFTNSRFHPVLNKWRAHKGVDYASPIGTKVKVTADGVVEFVGKKGGYGNVVMINHQGRYETVYGHLSRFGNIHKGQRVSQGEVIGYVGMTGMTSGPHLHYEFKQAGVHRDPLKVALPDGKPVNEAQKMVFVESTRDLHSRLSLLRNTRIAKLD
ncbi:MAG: peptidoglycan DD-metalloendopeptidase family protein [Sideroxydans sp.]|jgi:murein DD-endopeptidase MepM/ murein hydrolase activator NlpD